MEEDRDEWGVEGGEEEQWRIWEEEEEEEKEAEKEIRSGEGIEVQLDL